MPEQEQWERECAKKTAHAGKKMGPGPLFPSQFNTSTLLPLVDEPAERTPSTGSPGRLATLTSSMNLGDLVPMPKEEKSDHEASHASDAQPAGCASPWLDISEASPRRRELPGRTAEYDGRTTYYDRVMATASPITPGGRRRTSAHRDAFDGSGVMREVLGGGA